MNPFFFTFPRPGATIFASQKDAEPNPTLTNAKKKRLPDGNRSFLVAGAGFEPAT